MTSTADSNQLLEQALLLTTTMLEKAQSQLWDDISVLQQEREQLLNTVLPLAPGVVTTETQRLLQALLQQNQQIEQLCRTAKKDVQTELTGLNKNKKAITAYQKK